jgi:YggT family protein
VIVVVASVRDDLANYVNIFAYVYTVTIIIYVLVNLAFSAGLRIPYSRWSSAILGFLRDVCEPILRGFRRILPSFGGLDLSPIVAIIVLRLAGSLISHAIRG